MYVVPQRELDAAVYSADADSSVQDLIEEARHEVRVVRAPTSPSIDRGDEGRVHTPHGSGGHEAEGYEVRGDVKESEAERASLVEPSGGGDDTARSHSERLGTTARVSLSYNKSAKVVGTLRVGIRLLSKPVLEQLFFKGMLEAFDSDNNGMLEQAELTAMFSALRHDDAAEVSRGGAHLPPIEALMSLCTIRA